MRHVLFSPPDITEAEISEVVDALKSGWITTGPKTQKIRTAGSRTLSYLKSCLFEFKYGMC